MYISPKSFAIGMTRIKVSLTSMAFGWIATKRGSKLPQLDRSSIRDCAAKELKAQNSTAKGCTDDHSPRHPKERPADEGRRAAQG
jgi:hypothetical protein